MPSGKSLGKNTGAADEGGTDHADWACAGPLP
jgi:hypothetical protein